MATNINGTKLKKCNVNNVKGKRINVNGVKVWTAAETISGSTSGTVTAGSGYNGAGTTIYSDYVDVTDYSSVTVYGSLSGHRNNVGNGGCKLEIGLQGAISKSKSTTAYEGSTSTPDKAAASISETWDLTGVTGKVRCYNYFTCYSAYSGEEYSSGSLSWTFNP